MQKINFSRLEESTDEGTDIAKSLLLEAARATIRQTKDRELRELRQQRYRALTDSVDISYRSLGELAEGYWLHEQCWIGKCEDRFEERVLLDGLVYRMLRLFFLNHISSPFVTKKAKGGEEEIPDTEDFCRQNQLLFEAFATELQTVVVEDFPCFHGRIDELIESVKFSIMLDSTLYILYGDDKRLFKKIAVVVGAAATGFLAAPAIGAMIGGAIGLKGAAAVSYGLAKLGLGPLAAGGFGVVGGKFVVASTFGLMGAFASAKTKEGDAHTAILSAPILLAIGRILRETGDRSISQEINRLLEAREVELWKQVNFLRSLISMLRDHPDLKFVDDSSNSYQACDLPILEARLANVELSAAIYGNAVEMSKGYDWYAFGFDFWETPWAA